MHDKHQRNMWVVSLTMVVAFMAGTSLMSLSGLGMAAVSAPMFALSKITLSFGTWFFLINGVYFLAQLALLRRDFPRRAWLQLPVVALASTVLDIWSIILRPISEFFTTTYLGSLGVAACGMLIVSAGVAFLVAANVIYLPADGIVATISTKFGWKFSRVKLIFDLASVAVTVAITLAFLDEFSTIREATIISAFVGPVAGLILPHAQALLAKL